MMNNPIPTVKDFFEYFSESKLYLIWSVLYKSTRAFLLGRILPNQM